MTCASEEAVVCSRHWALVVLGAMEEWSLQAHEVRKKVEGACCCQKEEEEEGCPAGDPWMGGHQGEQVEGGLLLD